MEHVSEAIRYVGADDPKLDLFENQYRLPFGVSYNSYVILDKKIAIMDTIDKRATKEWMTNVKEVLKDRKPDYLVVQHMEPDHSANIETIANEYPEMKIVANAKTFPIIAQFTDLELTDDRKVEVKEGETLELGEHILQFFMAPMVHWPEVMVTYEQKEKVLFSADGFGTFGALEHNPRWIVGARRYYTNIVGKYGPSVQALLKKAAGLDINIIAPLHGPILKEDLGYYIEKYNLWSTYEPEDKGVLVAYSSIYGNTKEAALYFAKMLEDAGVEVRTVDLMRDDPAKGVEYAFKYDKIVLASITYDGNLPPAMEGFLYRLASKGVQKRKVGLIENGSWGPIAAKKMKEHLDAMKDMTVCENIVTIRSKRKDAHQAAFEALRDELLAE